MLQLSRSFCKCWLVRWSPSFYELDCHVAKPVHIFCTQSFRPQFETRIVTQMPPAQFCGEWTSIVSPLCSAQKAFFHFKLQSSVTNKWDGQGMMVSTQRSLSGSRVYTWRTSASTLPFFCFVVLAPSCQAGCLLFGWKQYYLLLLPYIMEGKTSLQVACLHSINLSRLQMSRLIVPEQRRFKF